MNTAKSTNESSQSEAMPLCQIEEMLEQLEYDEACDAVFPAGWSRIGHLLWS